MLGLDDLQLAGRLVARRIRARATDCERVHHHSIFSGSERPVKSYIRGLAGAFVVAGMLGVMGCGPDNESDASKVSAEKKDPGPVNPNAIKKDIPPQPKTQEEFFKKCAQSEGSGSDEHSGTQKAVIAAPQRSGRQTAPMSMHYSFFSTSP